MINQEKRGVAPFVPKRIFVGLLLCSLFLLLLVVALAWWLVSFRMFYLNKLVLIVILVLALLFLIILAVGLLGLVWSLWRAKEIPPLGSMMRTVTHLLFPLAVVLGKWFGLPEERIKNSFIQVSNQLVRTQTKAETYERIMILAPHCLQWVHCPHKITIKVTNCRRCGHCLIMDLLDLAQKTGTCLKVVTGGTMARKVIKEERPQAVVAIACERDLVSGLQDVAGLPVIGIINERPEGPCANTRVDLEQVAEAIAAFRGERTAVGLHE